MIPRTSQVERSPEKETSRSYFPTDDVFDSTLKVPPSKRRKIWYQTRHLENINSRIDTSF